MKKNLSASGTTFFNFFFRHWLEWKQFFYPVKCIFQRILCFGKWKNDFSKIQDFVLLIRAFFCWWSLYLKLGVNQFFRFFQFVTVEAVFLASGNRFFYRLLHYGEWKRILWLMLFLFRTNFVLVIRIKVKPFSKK